MKARLVGHGGRVLLVEHGAVFGHFITDLSVQVHHPLVGHGGALAHLKEVEALWLDVGRSSDVVSLAGNGALASRFEVCRWHGVSEWLRRLESRPAAVRVQLLILNQVGPDQVVRACLAL
jgi:hypothetical protein